MTTTTSTPMPTAPFCLTEDHLAFQESTRELVRSAFAGSILERAFSDHYPSLELKRMAANGLPGLIVPQDYGGQGGDFISLGILCEEAGWADPSVAFTVFMANIMADLLSRLGTPSARSARLPGLIAGEEIFCGAITEPAGGSDAGAMRTRAEKVVGGWKLTGEKTSITQAFHADYAIVFAQTDPSKGPGGVAALLVHLDQTSVFRQRFTDPGLRPLGRGSLTFDETFIPDDHLLGEVGRGFHEVMHEFDLTRTLIGLMVVGTAQRALDMAAQYVVDRTAFGRPIAVNQGVSFPIAEHATYLEAVRSLAYHTLGLRQAGLPHTKQAAMIKWWAPEVAFNAIKDSIVLHGQVGWSDEMPLQAMLRDVSGYFIGDGTPQINKLVIAREIIGREVLGR